MYVSLIGYSFSKRVCYHYATQVIYLYIEGLERDRVPRTTLQTPTMRGEVDMLSRPSICSQATFDVLLSVAQIGR